MTFQRLRMLVRLVTCFLIFIAVAVQRDGRVFGSEVAAADEETSATVPVVTTDDGTVINTATLASGIKGYGGPVPLEITIMDGRISDIKTLRNAESEQFFSQVRSDLLPEWVGTPVDEVAGKEVDGVSGATLSSNALNATVKAGVAYYLDNDSGTLPQASGNSVGSAFGMKTVAALLVVLCAAILPIFVRDSRYRYAQLALNVIVLGFWCGTFLSCRMFVNYISNGVNLAQSSVVLLMLVIAFIYPYFGRKGHYCAWVCPLGSIQELAGKATAFKLKMSPSLVRGLAWFQECLWLVLMFVMCAGIWFDWMDWELFSAFVFRQAATGVIIAAVLFVLLSVVTVRPYCRFVCPTGCLFKITQNTDIK